MTDTFICIYEKLIKCGWRAYSKQQAQVGLAAWGEAGNIRDDNNNNNNHKNGYENRRIEDDDGTIIANTTMMTSDDDNGNRSHDEAKINIEDIGRLELLEEALKESIAMTVQAELQVKLKEEALVAAKNKIMALESAFSSSAAQVGCGECEALRAQMRVIGQTLTLLRKQRNKHLEDIFDLKLEALSTAISEIDEQAAHLELSCREEDRLLLRELRVERDQLRRRIKAENDNRVRMLQQLDREAQLAPQNAYARTDNGAVKLSVSPSKPYLAFL